MIDIRDYSDKYAEQYDAHGFETVLVEVRRRQVLAALERYPHRSVLEVGCGLEPLFAFREDVERFVVVEPAAPFVAHARTLAAERHGVVVHEGFLESVAPALADEEFDVIVVSSLLHEVPDPRALLASILSLTRNGTVVHFNVPNVRSFHRLLALEMGLIADVFEPSATEVRFQRRTRFDIDVMEAMLGENGFRSVRRGTYFVKPFTHGQMERMLAAGIIDDAVIAGLERMTRYLPDMGCELFVDAVRA